MSLSLGLPNETEIHRLLRLDKDAVDNDRQVTLTDVTFLKKTENNYRILRARMSGQDVIVKFTYEDRIAIPCLEEEARIYVDYLKPLWGIHVPKFYGFYWQAPSKPSESSCACMILQYCGEPAVSDLFQLKDYRSRDYGIQQFRNDTMDIVFRLHSPKMRVMHGTLTASHILDFGGKPFLIDFAAGGRHKCLAWRGVSNLMREISPANEAEILQRIGAESSRCDELWAFLESIDYCVPRTLEFYGQEIAFGSITSAASLFERAIIAWPRFKSEEGIWNDSVAEWRRIRSNWKRHHPDATIEPPLGIVDFQEYLESDC